MLVSLIGLPGVGKSTIGRRLARRLEFGFEDCDALFEQRHRRRILDFFQVEGEERFRDAEVEILEELTRRSNIVIATGGGSVLRLANRDLLRSRTVCVYLRDHPPTLLRRLQGDSKRPLLQGVSPEERLRELRSQREPLYRETAAIEVETRGQSLEALVDSVLGRIGASSPGADALARRPSHHD